MKNKTYHVEFDISFRENDHIGLFIALEGIDASGKSTQVEFLKKQFEEDGKQVVVKNPFEGELGVFIRKILSGEVKIPPVALQYLISANRHIQQEEIVSCLREGKHVIIDRYIWSAVVYGILDKGADDMENTKNWLLVEQGILSMYHRFLMPDFTFYLDISAEAAMERLDGMKKEKEIYEDAEKIAKIEEIYKKVISDFPDEFVVIDGGETPDKITQEIMMQIKRSGKY